MPDSQDRSYVSSIMLIVAGALSTAGLAMVVFYLASNRMGGQPDLAILISGLVVAVIGVVLGLGSIVKRGIPAEGDGRAFSWAVVGVGYTLFLDGVITMVCLAGFAHAGKLNDVLKFSTDGTDSSDANIIAARLILALEMSVLGALFHITSRMRENQKKSMGSTGDQYAFKIGKFWGGLWFRLGQSVVYTAGVFLLLQGQTTVSPSYVVVLALFVGMFVEVAERTFYGIGQRLFKMIDSLIPVDEDQN